MTDGACVMVPRVRLVLDSEDVEDLEETVGRVEEEEDEDNRQKHHRYLLVLAHAPT